ncbi:hypothetical protein [Parasitella parasitica]|uniref:Reverse transcriptase domain-containing protein n=1 Tax=Parasitella parasitica TaxID=35722 RepID=A0A0B7MVF0_9FUNG|nr:hypothetical protein [Parasitella parasitica]
MGQFIQMRTANLQTTILIAAQHPSDCVALLLDQEKAYDRIHPEYLREVMQRFDIPSDLIHSLPTLLFSTQIHININGHIPESHIIQHRGIRQGDPISPLLYNVAFDSFRRSIHNNPNLKGFDFRSKAPPQNPSHPVDEHTTTTPTSFTGTS